MTAWRIDRARGNAALWELRRWHWVRGGWRAESARMLATSPRSARRLVPRGMRCIWSGRDIGRWYAPGGALAV